MNHLAALVVRRPRTVVAITLVLWILALVPASHLQLRLDLASLLPDGSPAAQAYMEYLQRFGGVDRVFVIVKWIGDDANAEPSSVAEAGARMAEILEESSEIVKARAGLNDEDEHAFLTGVVRRAPLLLPGDDWLDRVAARLNRAAIHDRVWEIRTALLSPIPRPTKRLAIYDPLGFAQDLSQFKAPGFGQLIDPITLGFLSDDGRAALVLVEPVGAELDAEAGRRLRTTIEEATARVQGEFGEDLQVRAVGGPLYAAHDEEVIRSDLKRTLFSTAIACGVLIVAVFGGIGIPIAGLAALGAGLTWLAAGLAITSGGVSAVVVGFAAVLVGLGVDAAIHGGTALRSLRLAGERKREALIGTFRSIGPPVIAAAATTTAAFAVLLASDLPPLRELGAVVAGGMVAVVFSTATLGAALALLLMGKPRPPNRVWGLLEWGVDAVVGAASRYPRAVLASAALLTAAALPAALDIELKPDLSGLRPSNHPVVEAERALADTFGIGEDTLTILLRGRDLDEALAQARKVGRVLRESVPDLVIMSPADRIVGPEEVARRLHFLRALDFSEAAETLRAALRSAGLNPSAFAPGFDALEALAKGRDPGEELPIRDDQLRFDPSGEVWAAVTVWVPEGSWIHGLPIELRTAVEKAAPGAMIASVPLLGVDLRRVAAHDLRRLSVLSLLLVVGVVLVSFRGRLEPAAFALVPVVLGTVWTLGLWSFLGRSLDLVGLAVLPVMLGLGIDDGLYATHGAKENGVVGIDDSIRRSGRAMALTTLTTCIGFGSLTLSHLPALQAAAILVPAGIGSCLFATLAVLPAMAAIKRGRE